MPLDQTGSFPIRPDRQPSRNVLGGVLQTCSNEPLTGFFRDGCCNTGSQDRGNHTVCAVVTTEFLQFSQERGNDLSTPRPEYGFPGLKHGDSWCLCATRWQEAFEANCAPTVSLDATHIDALNFCALKDLQSHAAQP